MCFVMSFDLKIPAVLGNDLVNVSETPPLVALTQAAKRLASCARCRGVWTAGGPSALWGVGVAEEEEEDLLHGLGRRRAGTLPAAALFTSSCLSFFVSETLSPCALEPGGRADNCLRLK